MKKTLLIFFALITLPVIIGITYIETGIDHALSKKNQGFLIRTVNNSPGLPDVFYSTTKKYFPHELESNTYISLYHRFKGQSKTCACGQMNHIWHYTHDQTHIRYKFYHSLIISRFKEKQVSQKKCFDFNLHNTEFGNNKGVTEACQYYFKKDLQEITEIEVIKLLIIRGSFIRYDPFRNPERLNKAVKILLKKSKN